MRWLERLVGALCTSIDCQPRVVLLNVARRWLIRIASLRGLAVGAVCRVPGHLPFYKPKLSGRCTITKTLGIVRRRMRTQHMSEGIKQLQRASLPASFECLHSVLDRNGRPACIRFGEYVLNCHECIEKNAVLVRLRGKHEM
jgi:hypothetical protein